ncbi:MAG: hypothetical protein KIT84_44030 [Labilithrix sp.]|nr:hypothetical protein [Labilithrix sp.]MCW5818048.1 hypothetical protein [Labilithrix sp.]
MRCVLPSVLFASFAFVGACSDDPAPPPDPPPKFEEDVMPILVKNCALASCHAAKESPLGVNITADPAVTYASLMKESTFFKGTRLVVPGKPEESLVMRKMDNTHAELESCPGDCGKAMPPPEDDNATGDEALLSKSKRDVIRAWIAAGAKDD